MNYIRTIKDNIGPKRTDKNYKRPVRTEIGSIRLQRKQTTGRVWNGQMIRSRNKES